MREDLEKKVIQSKLLICHAYRHARWRDEKLEVAISGGKDSDVLIELCKLAGVWGGYALRPLHRCTTIDPPGTLSHVISQGVEVLRPRVDFRHCIMRSGYPNRFMRHCCGELKEFAVEDYVLVGIRRCESRKRSEIYKEPEQCRVYNGRGKVIQYYPLLEWTDEDVAEFIEERGIKCHPLYYDEDGVFHVERRLGCMGCPLSSKKKRVEDFIQHPKMVRFYIQCGREFLRLHPQSRIHDMYDGACSWFVGEVFCDVYKDFCKRYGKKDGVVDLFSSCRDIEQECKSFLEEKFGIRL